MCLKKAWFVHVFYLTFLLKNETMQAPPPATNGPVIAGYFANW